MWATDLNFLKPSDLKHFLLWPQICYSLIQMGQNITVNGITDPEVLEALACAEALCLASDLHEARLLTSISLDYSNIVKEIQGELPQRAH